jgi:ribonuclease HII
VDEVGRGPLAGPVVAAAVHLAPFARLAGLDDSKKLSRAMREHLAIRLKAMHGGLARFGVGWAGVQEIDRQGIREATFLAMHRALNAVAPELPCQLAEATVVIDGKDTLNDLPGVKQMAVVGGDRRCRAVAAASVLAKVERDSWMRVQARAYPEYGFERHVGYGTAEHLAALREHGPCPLHRRSFAPVREAMQHTLF